MTTEAFRRVKLSYWLKTALLGIYAGFIGGYLPGVLMGLTQILPKVGRLFDLDRDWASFLIHAALSAFYGALFAILAVRFHYAVQFHFKFRKTIPAGIHYGVILWFCNVFILIPIVFSSRSEELRTWMNLIILLFAHLCYGIVTALLFVIFYWKSPRIRFLSQGSSYLTGYFPTDDKQGPGLKKQVTGRKG